MTLPSTTALMRIRKMIVLVLMTGGIVLCMSGRGDRLIDYLGMQTLSDQNDAYLTESFDKSVTGFLVLSAIKSGLAVVEGSEIGVGFNLELGDLVQSVYDYVDIAWKAALAGGTVILLTRLILEAATLVDHWCLAAALTVGLITLITAWGFPSRRYLLQLMRETTVLLVVFSVVLYLVLPISIMGAAYVSRRITGPLIDESQRSFESIQDDFSLDSISERLMPEDETQQEGWLSDFNLSAKYRQTKERIGRFVAYIQEKSRNIAIWTIQIVAGYLFDSIVFPATVFILLFVVTKRGLVYLFDSRRQQSFRKEMAAFFSHHRIQQQVARTEAKPKRLRTLRRRAKRSAARH